MALAQPLPVTKLLHRAQALVVDRVKRRAVLRLHRTARGEAFLLSTYLWAEEAAEKALLSDALHSAPQWLRAQAKEHLADEARHAALLKDRLAVLGYDAKAPPPAVDRLSRRKLAKLRALGRAAAPRFDAGLAVPALAVAWRMEAMGERVLARHLSALEASIAGSHPTIDVLRAILSDERRHVHLCEDALRRLVLPSERKALARLLARVDALERAFGIAGAAALWTLGAALEAAEKLPPFLARRGAREPAA